MRGWSTAGYTLVEIMVAIGVFAVLSSALMSSLTTSTRSFADRRIKAEAQQDQRTASYVLARALRTVGLDPLDTAGAGIELALASRITVSMDTNLNGAIDAAERITFVFDAAKKTLTRLPGDGTVGSGSVVAGNLSNLTFRYLDSKGIDLGTPNKDPSLLADIRSIRVDLTTEATRVGAKTKYSRNTSLYIDCQNL